MENKNVVTSSKNRRAADFVENASLSNESKDYLICLGMLEDLSDKMHKSLVRDWGEDSIDEQWGKWLQATEKVGLLIMENFKERLVTSICDLTSKEL